MKNTFILKLACVIIAIITSITLFACDTQEKGSETESVTDKATDKVTEEPTDADTESKTAESAVLESETESGLKKAKNFTVYDADGNKVKLADFFGKPIVLNFWASWCGACQSEMSAFDEVYNEYKDKITFLMVSVDDTMGEAQKYIQNSGYSFPYYHDTDYEGSITYGVSAIPITFFIDKDGHFVAYGNFAFDKATLMQGINMIYTP